MEIIEYGDGTFARGFKNGEANKRVAGNQISKVNTTTNLKVTIVK